MGAKLFLIIIGFVNPQEQESFDKYVKEIRLQYEAADARVVERYPILQSLTGDEKPDFIMVVEFPSQEALQKMFTSEAYQKIVPYREKGFKKLSVFISKK